MIAIIMTIVMIIVMNITTIMIMTAVKRLDANPIVRKEIITKRMNAPVVKRIITEKKKTEIIPGMVGEKPVAVKKNVTKKGAWLPFLFKL